MRTLPPISGETPPEISTEPPAAAIDVEPARREMLPATPAILSPVPRTIEPVFSNPAPDEKSNDPVRPAVEGAESKFTSPESPEPTPAVDDPPEPDMIETIPPFKLVEGPPNN